MMMQLDLRIRYTAMLLAVVASLFSGPVFSAELSKIRTGEKSGFTRIVFQFTGPARYLVKGEQEAGKLLLTFPESTSGQPVDKPASFAPPIQDITVHQEDANLKTDIALSIPQYRMKAFTLTGPDRVVFDIYPVAAAASTVQLNPLVVKASRDSAAEGATQAESATTAGTAANAPETPSAAPVVQAPAKEETAGVQADVQPPEPAADTPAAQPENIPETGQESAAAPVVLPKPQAEVQVDTPQKALPPSPQLNPPVNGRQPAQQEDFQIYLMVALGVISVVILTLIGFLLLQKKGNAAKTRQVASGEALKTTADVMAAIDAKIREKFKQYEESNPGGGN